MLGSYLLLKGDHTYVNMFGAGVESRLEWYPEYQVNLGPAQDPGGMPLTVDGYYDLSSQLYRRYFQNGLVLVNNSAASLVYQPSQVMQQVIINGWGGGVRDGDIDPATNTYTAGWLTSRLVSSVTVGPYSSVILINADAPIQLPPPPGPVPGGPILPFRVFQPSADAMAVAADLEAPSVVSRARSFNSDSGSGRSAFGKNNAIHPGPRLRSEVPASVTHGSPTRQLQTLRPALALWPGDCLLRSLRELASEAS